jgi:hypothetical protein
MPHRLNFPNRPPRNQENGYEDVRREYPRLAIREDNEAASRARMQQAKRDDDELVSAAGRMLFRVFVGWLAFAVLVTALAMIGMLG